ncbi:MAG TPA: hypothetical protein VL856_14185 [Acidimicrobiia bacterium]|jgi:hypothetical protein|nr:hypothetical protein [Acidimicrobiia bacterium]
MTSTVKPGGIDDADARPEEQVSVEDLYGVARYLADAVEHGDINEEDGAAALLEWAGPDEQLLERVATHLSPDSEAEHLLRAAYAHAA